jgi:uncharacterized protein (TIGR00303 family)
MIYLYTQLQQGQKWLRKYQGKTPTFACILGFTATGLIPGISAAGVTPQAREYTAVADAEFLSLGVQPNPRQSLPLLTAGASPVFISRAVIESLDLPYFLFNAGLLHPLTVDHIDLEGVAANCLTSGKAMPFETVKHLFQKGLEWGKKLTQQTDYLIIGECVVGGTTTALAILTGLGIDAVGKVNSSHVHCNHAQKWSIVEAGLKQGGFLPSTQKITINPLNLVAAVGDPMQVVAAGMTIAASQITGVMLAGGTQMLAVYALARAISHYFDLEIKLEQIVVGTTRWVVEDPTGDTVGLARMIDGVPLLATGLNFTTSRYPSFRLYEQGYVKEGVGAGGCAISAHLKQGWTPSQLLTVIETLFTSYQNLGLNSVS